MNARLRPLATLFLAGLLGACATAPSDNPLGELPRTPQASIEQLLEQAGGSQGEQANLLYLSAAEQALRQQDLAQAGSILQRIPQDSLKPAQQLYASILGAELALARNKPKSALKTLQNPGFEQLDAMPVELQIRGHLAQARALEGSGQALNAARSRVFIDPLLDGPAARDNRTAIWRLVSGLPLDQLQGGGQDELGGWLTLARLTKSSGTPDQLVGAVEQWRAANGNHPAAGELPADLQKVLQLAGQPLTRIALLLPTEGQLAQVGQALRDGFMAAHFEARQAGQTPPQIDLYDSARLGSLDDFYRQAQANGVQLVVGPLEKPLVKQLASRSQLPITTLALNYADAGQQGPAQLFQFGLAAEDEAREVARRAWDDGMRRAIALVPESEWGDRVLAAFQQHWQASGGTLIAASRVSQPVELAQQIGDLLQLRQSEARAKRLQGVLGLPVANQPTRRQDVDFIFLAATPQQARQIKPTLAFQYAGDLPVYGTSHLFSGIGNPTQNQDLDGIRFCETPWLLDGNDPLRLAVSQQWPQAAGSLGRLYAMGADAYRLAPRLSQLQALPDSHVEGASGNLSLTAGQRVQRQLPWAEYRDGQIHPLSAATP